MTRDAPAPDQTLEQHNADLAAAMQAEEQRHANQIIQQTAKHILHLEDRSRHQGADLHTSLTLQDQNEEYAGQLSALLSNTHFGRMDLIMLGKPRTVFIGRSAITTTEPLVISWDTDLAAAYYHTLGTHQIGKRSVTVTRRRSVDIHQRVVRRAQDLTLDRSVLVHQALERAQGGELRDVIESMQPEQDALMRDPRTELIIQGPAGSGKTTLLIHRAARLARQGRQVLLLVPTPHLAAQAQRTLNRLGASCDVMTPHQFTAAALGPFTATDSIIDALLNSPPDIQRDLWRRTKLLGDVRWNDLLQRTVTADRAQGRAPITGLRLSRTIIDRRDITLPFSASELTLLRRQDLRRRQNTEGIDASELGLAYAAALALSAPTRAPYDDLLIDEAQDLSPLLLLNLRRNATNFTLAGDLDQGMHGYRGPNSWTHLQEQLKLPAETLATLDVAWRSTQQVSQYAAQQAVQLRAQMRSGHRQGPPVLKLHAHTPAELLSAIETGHALLTEHNCQRSAVICRSGPLAARLPQALQDKHIDAPLLRPEAQIRHPLITTDVATAKGLEFAGVISVAPPSHSEYERRLRYVMHTRALHVLVDIEYTGHARDFAAPSAGRLVRRPPR